MRKLLWLDDMRDPMEDDWLNFSPIPHSFKTIWVKSFDEFTKWIIENGLPDAICFDHDLADEHYTPKEYWDDYDRSKKYQETRDYKEKTGYDCAKWLTEYCMDNNLKLPLWSVQSANPVGKDNINGILNHYKRTQEPRG